MSIRQYIQVTDDSVFIPEDIVIGMPGTGEILLYCTDEGDKRVAFQVTVSNSGQYTTKVYDAQDDELLLTANTNSNSVFSYVFPVNHSSFRIRITPAVSPNVITKFNISAIAGFSNSWYIKAAKFNTPYLSSLLSAFQANTVIEYCEFPETLNVLTTMNLAFSGCTGLKGVKMPTSALLLNNLADAFRTCIALESIILPALPALLTLSYAFNGSGLKNIVFNAMPAVTTLTNTLSGCFALKNATFPDSLPELSSLSSCFYNDYVLETLVLPASMPKVTTLSGMAYSCGKLKGILTFPEMPLCNSLANAFTLCKSLEGVHFTGAMNSCTSMTSIVQSCTSLKAITLPSSLTALASGSTIYWADGCTSLETIILPLNMKQAAIESTAFLYQLVSCYNVNSLSTCNSWPVQSLLIAFSAFRNLKRFDQPTLKVTQLNLSYQAGGMFTGILEYIEIDWENSSYSVGGITLQSQNIGGAEYERILSRLPKNTVSGRSVNIHYQNPLASDFILKNLYFAAGSVVLPNGNTSNVLVGMEISSASTAPVMVAVTTQAAASTVTLTNHRIPNGTEVSFWVLATTTGIAVFTKYYVVNAASNTFQVSATAGGAAITMTNDGTATMAVFPKVISIVTNVSIIISSPIYTAASNTPYYFSFRLKSIAIHKGWNVQ